MTYGAPPIPGPRGYWRRYGGRWVMTFAVTGGIWVVINLISAFTSDKAPDGDTAYRAGWLFGYVLIGSALEGAFFGSLVNLIVAIFPDRRAAPLPPAPYPPEPGLPPYAQQQYGQQYGPGYQQPPSGPWEPPAPRQ